MCIYWGTSLQSREFATVTWKTLCFHLKTPWYLFLRFFFHHILSELSFIVFCFPASLNIYIDWKYLYIKWFSCEFMSVTVFTKKQEENINGSIILNHLLIGRMVVMQEPMKHSLDQYGKGFVRPPKSPKSRILEFSLFWFIILIVTILGS